MTRIHIHIRMIITIEYSVLYSSNSTPCKGANFSKILPPAVSALSLNFANSGILEATTLSSLLVSPTA